MDIVLSEQNFEKEVLKADLPVLVDFYADWCGPCRMLSPIIGELAKELAGKVKVAKLNVDENQAIASKYGIMSVPTLILFKDGKEEKRIIGLKTKEELLKELT